MNRKRIPHAVSAEDAGRSTARAYLKMRFPALSDAHSVGKPQSSRSGLWVNRQKPGQKNNLARKSAIRK